MSELDRADEGGGEQTAGNFIETSSADLSDSVLSITPDVAEWMLCDGLQVPQPGINVWTLNHS